MGRWWRRAAAAAAAAAACALVVVAVGDAGEVGEVGGLVAPAVGEEGEGPAPVSAVARAGFGVLLTGSVVGEFCLLGVWCGASRKQVAFVWCKKGKEAELSGGCFFLCPGLGIWDLGSGVTRVEEKGGEKAGRTARLSFGGAAGGGGGERGRGESEIVKAGRRARRPVVLDEEWRSGTGKRGCYSRVSQASQPAI